MCKRFFFVLSAFLLILSASQFAKANLVAYYPLDGDSLDATGNGHNATSGGAVTYVAGKIGQAASFNGTSTSYLTTVDTATTLNIDGAKPKTICAWVNLGLASNNGSIWHIGGNGTGGTYEVRANATANSWMLQLYSMDTNPTGCVDTVGEWVHLALAYDGTTVSFYCNGALINATARVLNTLSTQTFDIGRYYWAPTTTVGFNGLIDDVQVYDNALTAGEILAAMEGVGGKGPATSPVPADKAVEVSIDTALAWAAGPYAATHNIFFSDGIDDINDNGEIGLTDAAYDPTPEGTLEYGKTYYWRVDEVNAAPDNTEYPGKIWSFTTEAYSYVISPAKVTVTADSTLEDSGEPNATYTNDPNFVYGGPTAAPTGSHSVDTTAMWQSESEDPGQAWIQYTLDKPRMLDRMLVWNFNGPSTSTRTGFKSAKIEYLPAGEPNWVLVGNNITIDKATGKAGYNTPTEVQFDNIVATAVKITANSDWFNDLYGYGLSEVRLYEIPTYAQMPNPANNATGVLFDQNITWKPGRGATEHTVYVDADYNDVRDGTANDNTDVMAEFALNAALDTKYYWRVDENDGNNMWAGDIWSFTTQVYRVVDGFESYAENVPGTEPNLVYNTWVDGYDTPATNGAVLGQTIGQNFITLSTTTVHGGTKSLPMFYGNGGVNNSEIIANTANLKSGKNWTLGGVKTLVIWFYGDPNNNPTTDSLYVKVGSKTVLYSTNNNIQNIAKARWTQWNIDLAGTGLTSAQRASINTVALGVNRSVAGAKMGVLTFDDILLYREAPAVAVATNPGTTGLVAQYQFENNLNDSSGNGLTGTAVGAVAYANGHSGKALSLNGTDAYVNCGNSALFNINDVITISCWVNSPVLGDGLSHAFVTKGDTQYGISQYTTTFEFTIYNTTWRTANTPASTSLRNAWHHFAGVYNGQTVNLYIDGALRRSVANTGGIANNSTNQVWIGNNSGSATRFFNGLIDDVRIYHRALTVGEILYLADN